MRKDGNWQTFLDDPARYADIINGLGCNGMQIVSPDDLQDADTQYPGIRIPTFVRKIVQGTTWKKPKIRDLVRRVAFGMNFAIVGIENQDSIDYSLPLRNMIYDVAEYEKQAARIRRQVRKNPKGLSPGEYLYGFKKDSRLFPVITFVLYGGENDWNGPTSLHEMLNFTDIPQPLYEMIPDYKVNIIPLRGIADTSIFKTDVKNVIDFIKCTLDTGKMKALISNDPYYQSVNEEAYDIMSSYMNITKMDIIKTNYMKEGKINMCEALRGWLEEEKAEGRAQGHAEGIIKTARKYHATDEDILQQLMEELSISREHALTYLKNIR